MQNIKNISKIIIQLHCNMEQVKYQPCIFQKPTMNKKQCSFIWKIKKMSYLTALNDEISSKIIKAGYKPAFWNEQLTILINSILINNYD